MMADDRGENGRIGAGSRGPCPAVSAGESTAMTREGLGALLEVTLGLRRALELLAPWASPEEQAEDRRTIRNLVERAVRLRSQLEGKE